MFCNKYSQVAVRVPITIRRINILPSTLQLSDAHKIFRENICHTEGIIEQPVIYQVILPHHIGSVDKITCQYTGRFGVNHTDTQVKWSTKKNQPKYKTNTVTNWYPVIENLTSMRIPYGHELLHFYTGTELSPIIVKETNNFRVPYDKLVHAENGTITVTQNIKNKIMEQMTDIINSKFREWCMNDLKNKFDADRHEIIRMDTCITNLKAEEYGLEAYLCVYKVDGEWYYKIINGWNGQISGRLTYNPKIMGKYGCALGGLGGIGFTFWAGLQVGLVTAIPASLVVSTILMMAFSAVGVLGSMAYNKYNHHYYVANYQNIIHTTLKRQEQLASSHNTSDQKCHKQLEDSKQVEEKVEVTVSNKKKSIDKYMVVAADREYLNVMGLGNRTWITKEVLDQARMKQLAEWETYDLGRKKPSMVADSSRRQIWEAYRELCTRFV